MSDYLSGPIDGDGDGHRNLPDALAVLVRAFGSAATASSAWLLRRTGPGAPAEVISGWDPDDAGPPARWPLEARALDDGLIATPVADCDGSETVICALLGAAPDSDSARQDLISTSESFAAAATLVLEDVGGFAEAMIRSRRDGLTGCLTYSELMYSLETEVRRASRYGRRLCCLFLDIDGFKQVNEKHGHLKGNDVLRAIGIGLRSAVRGHDLVGRFGGDEFVVVLPELGVEEGRHLADRLRVELRGASAAIGVPVELSVGIAELEMGMVGEDLLEAADAALRVARGAEQRIAALTPLRSGVGESGVDTPSGE